MCMKVMECTFISGKHDTYHDTEGRDRRDMSKTWWIRRWYFLYISVSDMLPNFRNTCHAKVMGLWTCDENVER
ncbi:hypothetical protein Hanom_Chr09g00797531 [Helianthus anomalus]